MNIAFDANMDIIFFLICMFFCLFFKNLQNLRPLDECLIGQTKENKKKNRYKNIVPCELGKTLMYKQCMFLCPFLYIHFHNWFQLFSCLSLWSCLDTICISIKCYRNEGDLTINSVLVQSTQPESCWGRMVATSMPTSSRCLWKTRTSCTSRARGRCPPRWGTSGRWFGSRSPTWSPWWHRK